MTENIIDKKRPFKIAIVGAGIGGASCAYFLKQLFEDEIEIDIYEKSDVVGGRLATLEYNGREYETGGSIIHPSNLYMDELRKICGFDKVVKSKCNKKFFGIFNENGFCYENKSSYFDFIDTIKLVWNFGFFQMIKFHSWISKFIQKFSKVYSIQNKMVSFSSVDDFLTKIHPDFAAMTQMSMKELLKKEKFSDKIIELSSVASLVNYCQPLSIHGFVGIVASAGVKGDLWRVKGGNRQVANKLLQLSKTNVILNAEVKSVKAITVDDVPANTLTYEKDGSIEAKDYDYVVIAFPLTKMTPVKELFPDFQCENYLNYELQVNHTYFVEGNVHLYPQIPLNRRVEILSCDDDVSYRSVATLLPCDYSDKADIKMWTDNGRKLFKMFSKDILSDETLTKIFGNDYKIVKKIDWFAYPKYVKLDGDTKQIEFPNIFIDSHERSRVLYINAIEWAASCMEVCCIGARNIANIIAHKESKERNRKYNKKFHIKLTPKSNFLYNCLCAAGVLLSTGAMCLAIWFQLHTARKK